MFWLHISSDLICLVYQDIKTFEIKTCEIIAQKHVAFDPKYDIDKFYSKTPISDSMCLDKEIRTNIKLLFEHFKETKLDENNESKTAIKIKEMIGLYGSFE